MTKKVMASAIILSAVTLFATGVTYAGLKAKTESVVNDFQGACVNIGVVEKNQNNNECVFEDAGTNDNGIYDEDENNNFNIYEGISADSKTKSKEVSIKNITSENYPTTDTYVRVRLVPMLVYDDNEINRKAGVAGQTVPLDMRDKVDYILSDNTVSEEVIKDWNQTGEASDIKDKEDEEAVGKRWVYMESATNDVNDRYYYYTSPLAPGEVSCPLLKAVTYKGEIPDNAHFELRVLSEGIAAYSLQLISEQ